MGRACASAGSSARMEVRCSSPRGTSGCAATPHPPAAVAARRMITPNPYEVSADAIDTGAATAIRSAGAFPVFGPAPVEVLVALLRGSAGRCAVCLPGVAGANAGRGARPAGRRSGLGRRSRDGAGACRDAGALPADGRRAVRGGHARAPPAPAGNRRISPMSSPRCPRSGATPSAGCAPARPARRLPRRRPTGAAARDASSIDAPPITSVSFTRSKSAAMFAISHIANAELPG